MGRLRLVADDTGITGILFADDRAEVTPIDRPGPGVALLVELERQLDAYFDGALRDFDLPLHAGGTPFQQRVWEALRAIPYGRTASYGQLARQLGRPGAARAVGAANGRNPLSIVVPCHRVIGASGTLTGYGGGVRNKRWLLDHERRVLGHGGNQLALLE